MCVRLGGVGVGSALPWLVGCGLGVVLFARTASSGVFVCALCVLLMCCDMIGYDLKVSVVWSFFSREDRKKNAVQQTVM